MFLVGALRKKARLFQWVVFSADDLALNGPLFLQFSQSYNILKFLLSLRCSIFTSSKKLNEAKGYYFRVFSALWDFFEKKFITERSPFNFLIFFDRMDVEKSQRVYLASNLIFGISKGLYPLSIFLWHCETFFRKKIHQKVPLHFLMFCNNGSYKMRKGNPF